MFCENCGKQIDEKAIFCIHCGVLVKNSLQTAEQPALAASLPENGIQAPKKFNGLSIAGFVVAVASIALGMLLVFINLASYIKGIYLQYFCAIPLAVALGLSIAGTVKAKKQKTGMGFGIAGIAISGGVFVLTAFYFIFMLLLAYAIIIVLLLITLI